MEGSHLLWVKIQMSPIDLVESPQQVFRRSIDIVPSRVVGEVIAQWTSLQLSLEEIDLVEK